MPILTVFAGPNGSGKSSVIRIFEFEGKANVLDSDPIAKNWTLPAIKSAPQQGFVVRLIYLCVDTSDVNVRRVRERVAQGGSRAGRGHQATIRAQLGECEDIDQVGG